MNILISVNDNYIKQAEVMLYSISLHIKEKINVYSINISLSEQGKRELTEFIGQKLGGGGYIM